MALMVKLLVCVCAFPVFIYLTEGNQIMEKRGFVSQGCMGIHDRSEFQRLTNICDECFDLFREPDLPKLCRSNCFKNTFFWKCVDALLLTEKKEELNNSLNLVYGK